MKITERLLLPPEQRCGDCQLYSPDIDGRCSACIRYEKRTGTRRPPFYQANPVQMTMRIEQTSERPQGGTMSDPRTKTREFIPFDLIDPNPFQPRLEYDLSGLLDLADSIYQLDVLQAPLGRRTASGRVEVAFGHRRTISCWMLHENGLYRPGMDMDVADLTDEEMAVMALTENERRKELTRIEVLRAHRKAVDETDLTVQALADQLGIPRPTLANNLRVLALPDFVLEHVETGALGITVARSFLALQNGDHAHVEDMRSVINQITDNYDVKYEGAPPNWSRRNVRNLISQQVANNEKDFRPLGQRESGVGGHGYLAGAAREAGFDVEAFAADHPDALHTIPNGDKSRLWTCAVKDWRSWQTRATREGTKAAEAAGVARETPVNKSADRNKQFEQALGKDPVWRGIVANRENKGPNRPVTAEEKAALGTRAELNVVDMYGDAFWKTLANGRPEYPREWEGRDGNRVPPFFKLSGCQGCVAGAAYATSRPSYYWNEIRLICTNKTCYDRKVAGDEAVHREQVEAKLTAVDRLDGETIKVIMGRIALLTRKDLRTLASSLIAAQPELELTHTMGVPHKKWSYKSMTVRYVTGMLTHRPAHFDWYQVNGGKVTVHLESLDEVPDGDLLELAATLMTYHLRQARKLDDQDAVPAEEREMEAVSA